jgi:2-methylisocitrate lyase-like PEP mutase family enzyme
MGVTREEMFDRIRTIVDAVNVPVNGDLEAGYGDSPQSVAETIRLAIQTGLAGGNIEDRMPHRPGLDDEALAVERIRAARATIDASGSDFVLTARTDAFQTAGKDSLRAVIRRCNLFREAGADCLFAPGPSDTRTVEMILHEIDGPLNVVMGLGNAAGNARDLLNAGVQRISLGASIARSALALIRNAAREMIGSGTVNYAANQVPQASLSELFLNARAARADG